MTNESNMLKKEILRLEIQNKDLRTKLAKANLELEEIKKTNKTLIKLRVLAEDEVRRLRGD